MTIKEFKSVLSQIPPFWFPSFLKWKEREDPVSVMLRRCELIYLVAMQGDVLR